MKNLILTCCVLLFIMACNNNKVSIDEEQHENVKRVGMVVKIKKEMLEKYDIDDLTFEKDFYEFCALLKYHQIIVQGDPLDFN